MPMTWACHIQVHQEDQPVRPANPYRSQAASKQIETLSTTTEFQTANNNAQL